MMTTSLKLLESIRFIHFLFWEGGTPVMCLHTPQKVGSCTRVCVVSVVQCRQQQICIVLEHMPVTCALSLQG